MSQHGIKVLSLFDGMACAYAALKRAGIPVAKYYAVELASARYPREIAWYNHPGIIHWRDDVRSIYPADCGKPHLPKIDLVIGGFPCQSFSNAGNMKGTDDPRGSLIHQAMRIIRLVKPRAFLLENVVPAKKHRAILNDIIGYPFTEVNSACYGAQNRRRAWWSSHKFTPKTDIHPATLADVLSPEDDPLVAKQRRFPVTRFPAPTGRLLKVVGTIHYKKHNKRTHRVYGTDGKAGTVLATHRGDAVANTKPIVDNGHARRLTVPELARLQNLPADYIPPYIPKTAAIAAIGNGMDIAVLADILSQILKSSSRPTPCYNHNHEAQTRSLPF